MSTQWYRMFDPDPKGVFEIKREEAEKWNEQNFGIFWAVNSFRGRRRIENLLRINAWAVDIDQGTKDEQWAKIRRGLKPSLIVETKRGFQIYFLAVDADPENYTHILKDRLTPFYGGDQKAMDLPRILRVPGFYHCKDPKDRFMVERIHHEDIRYTEEDIFYFYRVPKKLATPIVEKRKFRAEFTSAHPDGGSIWERIWNMNCEYALEKLSGHTTVNFEVFTFKKVPRGRLNILVNGKSTSCWLDSDRRIGSSDGGGPSIYQWVRWYGHSKEKTLSILKEVFPELCRTNPKNP